MELKNRIPGMVHDIDRLRSETEQHWKMVQNAVTQNNIDDAISLLKAYFHKRQNLERAEADLIGLLSGYFSEH